MNKLLKKSILTSFKRTNVATSSANKGKLLPSTDSLNFMCSELKNGVKVLSSKSLTDLSRIIIVLNAGSRFEQQSQLGVCHVIRHSLLGSNVYNSHITNTRCFYQIGSDVSVECTRDNIIVKAAIGSRYLFNALDFLGTAICYPKFYHWEIAYALQSCLIDYDNLKCNRVVENVIEELHNKVFRSGYGNSLFVTSECESNIREYDVAKFFSDNVSGTRCVVGVHSNLSHQFIDEYVSNIFQLKLTARPPKPVIKSYSGETIIPYDNKYIHTAFGSIAPADNDPSWAIFEVLKNYLGMYKERSSCTSSQSKLGSNLSDKVSATEVSTFYMPYAHTGLFGIYMICKQSEYSTSIKELCKALGKIFNENVDEKLLGRSITKAKLDLASKCWNTSEYLQDTSVSLCNHEQLPNWSTKMAQLDSVTAKSLKDEITKLANGKPNIVSSGEASHILPADDIFAFLKK